MSTPIGVNWRHTDPSDIVGRRFGKLMVTTFIRADEYQGTNEGQRQHRRRIYRYSCTCDCGRVVEAVRTNLLNHHTTSCGCLKRRAGNAHPTWKGHGEISKRFWGTVVRHAAERNLSFDVSIEEAWGLFQSQGGRCALTGWPLHLATHRQALNDKTASLDRIDSSRGYTLDNVQWVHKDVNRSKWDHSLLRFYEICEAVTRVRQGSP